MDSPLLIFGISCVLLWLAGEAGAYVRAKRQGIEENQRQDLSVLLTASLTLLGLIVGFSFSMAVVRYDQRKNYEENEANAIGTEYLRIGLLPANEACKGRELIVKYLNQRVRFYVTRDARQIRQIDLDTARLQNSLWTIVQTAAAAEPTPIIGLAVSGMNDVINTQGYTQAAWWNRVPVAAWALMGLVGVGSNILFGYTARGAWVQRKLYLILPLFVATAFSFIADLDSPRGGIITVQPRNLLSLADSLKPQQLGEQR